MPIQNSSKSALRLYDDDKIPAHEQRAIQQNVEVIRQAFADPGRGKYTLDITLLKLENERLPMPGQLKFWASGARTYAKANQDTKLYLCPGKHLRQSNCDAVMPAFSNFSSKHICPSCGTTWSPDQMIGEVLARLTYTDWARVIASYFVKFESCANFALTIRSPGLHSAVEQEMQRDIRNARINQVEKATRTSYYNFPRLAADLQAGASLEGRIRAFLMSGAPKNP